MDVQAIRGENEQDQINDESTPHDNDNRASAEQNEGGQNDGDQIPDSFPENNDYRDEG